MMLRIPAGLKDHLVEMARANGRSINAQVIALIEAAIEEDERAEELAETVADHEERIKELERDIVRLLDNAGLLHR